MYILNGLLAKVGSSIVVSVSAFALESSLDFQASKTVPRNIPDGTMYMCTCTREDKQSPPSGVR